MFYIEKMTKLAVSKPFFKDSTKFIIIKVLN